MPKVTADDFIKAFTKYLGCSCTPIKAANEAALTEIYLEALQEGKQQGYIPLIIVPDDTLWENCKFNTAPDDRHSDFLEISTEETAAYRKQELERILDDGKEFLDEALEERRQEYLEEYQEPLPIGQMGDDEAAIPLNTLLLGMEKLPDMLLAKLPITDPWLAFAFVPFGNWNDCPDTPDLMAVSKYWYEKYQAYPAMISSSVLNFYVGKPATAKQAMELATEHFALCADIVDQGTETIGALADSLCDSEFWFFWWD